MHDGLWPVFPWDKEVYMPPRSSGAAARVLLIAQPLVSWGLERLLQTEPKRFALIGMAASVAEALLNLHSFQPDVVLLDLDGEDGTESLADLTAQTSAKVLAITMSGQTSFHDGMVLAGASGVVTKKESPSTLLRALECVAAGEMWLDRLNASRLLQELARRQREGEYSPNLTHNDRIRKLTRREREMIAALCARSGVPGKVLAAEFGISENTLRNHLTSIYRKLGVGNRTELYAYAQEHGLAAAHHHA